VRPALILILLLAAGCQPLEPRSIGHTVDLSGVVAGVVIAATDFQRGAGVEDFVVLNPPGPEWRAFSDLELLSADPVVRAFSGVDPGHVWAVNRLGFDNIQVLATGHNFASVAQFSVGNGSNPQDILVISPDKAYVTRYESPYNDVLIVHPLSGKTLGTIPLAAYASNPDHLPRPAAMLRVGDLAFIALQNLDASFNWGEDTLEPGRLVVVDVRTDQVVDADTTTSEPDPILLSTRNAQALAYSANQDLIYVASAGLFVQYHPEWGGLEAVDPNTLKSMGVILTGSDPGINGNVENLALTPGSDAYLLVSALSAGNNFQSKVIQVSLSSGLPLATIYTAASDAMISDLALDPQGLLLIADRWPKRPALVIYDTASGKFMNPVPLEPPPFSLALWEKGP
jgi:hypothetical protein